MAMSTSGLLITCMITVDMSSSVFVAHDGIDLKNPPETGDTYWKGKIVSLHRRNEDSECFAIISWYYSAADVETELVQLDKRHVNDYALLYYIFLKLFSRNKEILKCLGDHELLLGDHRGVIEVAAIAGKSLDVFVALSNVI